MRIGMLLTLGALLATRMLTASSFEIMRNTVDGGGMMGSTGGAFELSGTIGQPDAGTMTGGTFELSGGFWFPLDAGDCNDDGAVNLADHTALEACLSGPGVIPLAGCSCYDLDRNGSIDLADFSMNQRQFNAR